MADAGTHRKTSDLRSRISRTDQEGWGAVRALRDLERYVFRGVYHAGSCRVCVLLWPIRPHRSARSDDHPNCTQARLLFPMALRSAFTPSSITGNPFSSDRSCLGHYWPDPSAVSFRRRRKELEASADCGCNRADDRDHPGHVYSARPVYALESAYECLERRSSARTVHSWNNRARASGSAGVSGQAVPQLPLPWQYGRTKGANPG